MELIKKYMNYVGLSLIFTGLVTWKIWPYKKTVPLLVFALGVTLLAAYLFLNLSTLKQSLKRKSFLYSSNLFLIIILVLGILILVNYFFARHHHRFDFTTAKLHSLSDQSVKVLYNLKNEVRVKSFFRAGNFSKAKMENLLKNYSYHSSKIKYEFIDPDKNPGLVKRYEIKEDGTTIFEMGDKESRVTSATEEDISNAIIKISRERKKAIVFLEGHGEKSIEEAGDDGYSLVKEELGKQGYEVKKINLALSNTFPPDTDCLIIPGPDKDLLPQELDTLRNYIAKGGKVFFMVDPETAPGMTSFLKEYGIQLENDLIVDTVSRLLGGDYFMPVVNEYESHTITNKFRYATFFPYARSVETTENKPEGISVEILAKTSSNSWSERQLDERQVSFNKDTDKPGPVSLAAVVTIKKEEKKDEAKEEGKDKTEKAAETQKSLPQPGGRVAVFGDSDFASNRYYNLSGNGNLFLNTVNWLTEEADLISIQAKTSAPRTIQLTPSQGKLIFFVSLVILPLLVLLIGISVWIRRKSL